MPDSYQSQFPAEYALHKKYSPSSLLLELVWNQGCIVADITAQLLQAQAFDTASIDPHLLTQASLMHDIGVYQSSGFEWLGGTKTSSKPYIQHSIVGAWLLLKEGFPPDVVQAAYTHKGAGITAMDISKLGLDLPPTDYVPTTTMAKLISYAGKHHSKAPKWRTPEEVVKSLSRYGTEKSHIFAEWYEFFGPVDLPPLQKKYESWHAAITSQINRLQGNSGNLQALSV